MDAPRRPLRFILLKAALQGIYYHRALDQGNAGFDRIMESRRIMYKSGGFRSRFCFLLFLIFIRTTGARLKNQHRLLDGQHAQSFETRIYNFQYLLNDLARWLLREDTSSYSKWYVPRWLELRLPY